MENRSNLGTRPKAAIRSSLERSQKLPGGSTLDGLATEAEHTFPLVLYAATPHAPILSKNQSIAVEVKVQLILQAPIYPAASVTTNSS